MDFDKIKNAFELAIKAVLNRKVRALLTILAISIGISAVIIVYSAGYGLKGLISKELETFGTDIIEIETKVPNTSKTSNENASSQAQGLIITTFKNKDIEAIRKNSNISFVYGAIMGQEVVNYESEMKKFFLMGIGYEAPDVDGTKLEKGRFFSKEEENGLSQVAVLGYGSWKKLFNENDPVGKSISIKGKKFRVIGVLEERGSAFFMNLDDQIFIPIKTMQKRILGVDYITFAVAKMKNNLKSKQTQEELTYALREQHDITDPNKDDFAVNTMDEAEQIFGKIIGSITTLLIALVGISLVVGGVGIMNIMYVSVAERTFEIGLRKSLGAKAKDILLQFLSEALIITVSGGIVGVIIGAILAFVIKLLAVYYGFSWKYYISPQSIIVAVGFSIIVGLIFGLYPAKKAANLDPIVALRKD